MSSDYPFTYPPACGGCGQIDWDPCPEDCPEPLPGRAELIASLPNPATTVVLRCAHCGEDAWRETVDEDGRSGTCTACGAVWVESNRGALDLGIVRDPLLGSTNKLEVFFEEFTSLAATVTVEPIDRLANARKLNDLRRQSPEVAQMVRRVLVAEELDTVSALIERDPEVFDALYEMCEGFLELEVSNPDQWEI